ncbi:unnamed protein product [Penicillium palitans]
MYEEFRLTIPGCPRSLIIESKKYNPTTGIPSFLKLAARSMFGDTADLQKIASVQAIGGTGANRIGAVFLQKHFANEETRVYIGTPGWPNHPPIFTHAGIPHETYNYLNTGNRGVDMGSILSAIETAPPRSIFVLQGCCQNPSGSDLRKEEWKTLAYAFKDKKHLAFFDVAYQGLGTTEPDGGMSDVWGIRHFVEQNIDVLVCQSFSKNMGLYSERTGVLHVACHDSGIAERVKDALRALIRWEFSSASAYGARLAETILENPALKEEWKGELAGAAKRLVNNRERLYYELSAVRKTPGDWKFLVEDKGLFSLTGLSENQVDSLIERHIYLPRTGRINVAGLNEGNMIRVADSIDSVIRKTQE